MHKLLEKESFIPAMFICTTDFYHFTLQLDLLAEVRRSAQSKAPWPFVVVVVVVGFFFFFAYLSTNEVEI